MKIIIVLIKIFVCRLAELDQLEQTVKSGTHPEYVKLVNEIESKRAAKIKVTQASYEHYMANYTETFETTRKAANDHYMVNVSQCTLGQWL